MSDTGTGFAGLSKSPRMTWDQFKAHVDAALLVKGVNGSVRIWYIDVSYPVNDAPAFMVKVDPIHALDREDEPWKEMSIS